jgi:hypothetical protein
MTITGANVSVTGTNGVAIGAQSGGSVGSLGELGGNVLTLASPAAGIGGIASLAIAGGVFDCTGVTGGACLSASTVRIGAGSTVAITGRPTVVDSADCVIASGADVYFEYLGDSQKEQLMGRALIHVGSISLPSAGVYTLRISKVDANGAGGVFEREVTFNKTRAQGCAFSVGSVGYYNISFRSNAFNGNLQHDRSYVFAASAVGDNLIALADHIPLATPSHTPPKTPSGSFAPSGAIGRSSHFNPSGECSASSTLRRSENPVASATFDLSKPIEGTGEYGESGPVEGSDILPSSETFDIT